MRHPGEVLSRTRIIEHVWDFAYEGDSNVVDVYVRYLREKVDRPFGRRLDRDGARRRLPAARGAGGCGCRSALGSPSSRRPHGRACSSPSARSSTCACEAELIAAVDAGLRSRADVLLARRRGRPDRWRALVEARRGLRAAPRRRTDESSSRHPASSTIRSLTRDVWPGRAGTVVLERAVVHQGGDGAGPPLAVPAAGGRRAGRRRLAGGSAGRAGPLLAQLAHRRAGRARARERGRVAGRRRGAAPGRAHADRGGGGLRHPSPAAASRFPPPATSSPGSARA